MLPRLPLFPFLSRVLLFAFLGGALLLAGCDSLDEDQPVRLRVVHAAPGLDAIDVALDFDPLIRGLEAREASPYTRWDPGLQLVVVETIVDDVPVSLTREVFLESGRTYTLVVTGTNGAESLLLLPDDASSLVPGEARIRAVHAAERTDLVDLFVAPVDDPDPVLDVLDLSFGQFTQDVAVDTGSYDIIVETIDGSRSATAVQALSSQRRYLVVITNAGASTALSLFVVEEG